MVDRKLRVLWATDGSANAHGAIPFLRDLILPAADDLTVLAVAPHALLSGARPDPAFLARATPSARRKALAESHAAAERSVTALDPGTRVIEVVSRWGNPIETVLRVARSSRTDLIVMGAKGHSSLGLVLLGSVSQGVVQNATQSVLVARPGVEFGGRIVLGYDGSPAARRAVRFLERLDPAAGTEIVLCTVLEPFTLPAGTPVAYRQRALEEAHKINERQHQRAERSLRAVAEQLDARGRRVHSEVRSGQASTALDDVAREHGAGLVVVGSRKPSPARHYLVGSTAEKLVRHCHASVLIVR